MAANRCTEYGPYMVMERVSGSDSPTNNGTAGSPVLSASGPTGHATNWANASVVFYSGSTEATSRLWASYSSGTIAQAVATYAGSTTLADARKRFYLYDEGGEYLESDGTDMTVTSGNDIVLDATADIVLDAAGGNIEFKDDGTTQLTLDMDGTGGAQIFKLGVNSDRLVFQQYDGTEVLGIEDDASLKVAGGAGSSGVTITSAGQLTADGRVIVDDGTDATSTTDGSLQTDGGLSVAKDVIAGNDVKLLSDSAVLSLGAGSDATFTHDGTTGLTIAATPISVDSTGGLDLSSTTGDINFQDGGTTQLSLDMDGTGGEIIMQLKVDDDDFVFKQYDGTEVFRVENDGAFDIAGGAGSSGVTVTAAGQLTADGRVIVDDTTNATSTTDGSLQTDGGLSVALDAVIGDDLLLLSDSAVLSLGAGSDATLTHDGTTGVTLAANPITLDSAAAITLDADDGSLIFKDGGTEIGRVQHIGDSNLMLSSSVSDKDIIFAGNDGGSKVTALTLDMSEAGNAIFNAAVTAGTSFIIGSADLNETDMEKLDGITDGTAAANKAVVLDANKSITGITAITASNIQVDILDVNILNSITKTANTLEIVDKTIVAASGSASAAADGGGLQIGGTAGSDSVASVTYSHGDQSLGLNLGGSTIASMKSTGFVPAADSAKDLGADGTAWETLYVDNIDLNGQGRIDLNDDADTSMRASASNVITFEIGGTDELSLSATALYPESADGCALGSTSKEWSDLYLADSSVIYFGDDQEVTLTHQPDAGLLLSDDSGVGTTKLMFGDTGTYVHQAADGQLDVVSDTLMQLTAPTIDIEGATAVKIVSDAVTFGEGGNTDVAMNFNASSNSGLFSWMEDEDHFLFADDVSIAQNEKLKLGADSDYLMANGAGQITLAGQSHISILPGSASTLYMGSDGGGKDIIIYGGASNEKVMWDASENYLQFSSNSGAPFLYVGGDSTDEFAIDVVEASTNQGKIRASAFVTYSDETLKTNIAPMDNAVDTIMKLQGVSFDWKSSGRSDFGFIAQDLQKVLPECVSGEDSKAGVMGVDYSRLTAVLVEAMKAQQTEIETLKSAIAKLSK